MRFPICLLVLFLTACASSKPTSQVVEPLASRSGALTADTTIVHLPDSLAGHTQAKTAILARLFTSRKLKGNTIVIQLGDKPQAVVTSKPKAPVAVAAQAPALAVGKTKAPVAASSGSNSPISQPTEKKSVLFWWVLAIIAAFACFYYYKTKK